MRTRARKINIGQIIRNSENPVNSSQKVLASLPRNTKINWILNENRKPSDSEISEETES